MISEINYCLIDNKTALLVEDEPINQIVSSKILEKIGFVVEVASNGIEAIKMFEFNNYDVIFMDLQMPFMDGFEATLKIREQNKDIPIIALTASVLIEDKSEVENKGFNDFLQKPIQEKLLKNCITSFFETYVYQANGKEQSQIATNNNIKSEKQVLREEVEILINQIENNEYIKSTTIENIIKKSKVQVFDLEFVDKLKKALQSFNNTLSLKYLKDLKEHLA